MLEGERHGEHGTDRHHVGEGFDRDAAAHPTERHVDGPRRMGGQVAHESGVAPQHQVARPHTVHRLRVLAREPYLHPLDLHLLGHDAAEPCHQLVDVEDRGERLTRRGHRGPVVVRRPEVERVDQRLDTAAKRVEDDDEHHRHQHVHRRRDLEIRQDRVVHEGKERRVDDRDDRGHDGIADRLADDAVDAEEVVASDRVGDRRRKDRERERQVVERKDGVAGPVHREQDQRRDQ